MSDETAEKLKANQDMLNAAIAANPGAMPDMTADPAQIQAQMAAGMAYADSVKHVQEHGVEAPAVICSIRPTSETDMGGGRKIEFDVTIRPAVDEAYETQISQHMLPVQLQRLSEGNSITVKYDPDDPGRRSSSTGSASGPRRRSQRLRTWPLPASSRTSARSIRSRTSERWGCGPPGLRARGLARLLPRPQRQQHLFRLAQALTRRSLEARAASPPSRSRCGCRCTSRSARNLAAANSACPCACSGPLSSRTRS